MVPPWSIAPVVGVNCGYRPDERRAAEVTPAWLCYLRTVVGVSEEDE